MCPSTVSTRRSHRIGLALLLVVAFALGGCSNRRNDALDIKLFSVDPDPVVVDLSAVGSLVTFKIGYALIGSGRDSSCGLPNFTFPLAGILGSLSSAPGCEDKGDFFLDTQITFNPIALRSEPSGKYAARVEMERCIDPDLDPTPGARDCVSSQRDFMIELRGAAPPAPPPAPQRFTATVEGGAAVVLAWREERRALAYVLERQAGSAAFAPLATLPAFTATYRDSSEAANTDYTYRLTATNDTGSSAPVTASARNGQTRSLTLTVEARGSDSVSSVPAGIACPGDCSQVYLLNEVVQLTATPSTLVSGFLSPFRGWSGDADCSDGSVTMDADKACTAQFTTSFDAKLLTVNLAGSGSGRVTSSPAGIDCPGLCSGFFVLATSAVLTATPAAGSVFVAWTGAADCASGIPTMNADITCTANFASITVAEQTLTVYVQGTGTVTSAPAGIQCSGAAACPARFARNQVVVLTATPGNGQRFLGWAGAADCADGQVTMGADLTCVANFVSASAQWVTGAAALNQGSQSAAAYIQQPAIMVDAAGRPVVAWTEDQAVYLYRPFGAGVTRVSVNPSNAGPSLVMEPSDGPLVAFTEETATERRNVRLRRFPSSHAPGSAWADVGPGPLDTTAAADARDPCVVIRNGRITVAWVEGDVGVDLRIVVRSWDGTQWSAVGNGSGPAPSVTHPEIERPRLVVAGAAGSQSLALMWADDFLNLQVAELVGDNWVATATAPYAGPVQTDRADMMWTADLGLVVAAAAQSSGSVGVRRWSQGQWADVGSPRGDANPGSFLLALAFSHGPIDATPLLAYAVNRSAVQETVVERFVSGGWLRLGNALPAIDRHTRSASPRAVAVADHAQPEVAVVLQGVLPGTATTDRTLAVYRFE